MALSLTCGIGLLFVGMTIGRVGYRISKDILKVKSDLASGNSKHITSIMTLNYALGYDIIAVRPKIGFGLYAISLTCIICGITLLKKNKYVISTCNKITHE
jgi:hypothetical protein